MIWYTDNTKETTENLFELLNYLNQAAEYKINIQKKNQSTSIHQHEHPQAR